MFPSGDRAIGAPSASPESPLVAAHAVLPWRTWLRRRLFLSRSCWAARRAPRCNSSRRTLLPVHLCPALLRASNSSRAVRRLARTSTSASSARAGGPDTWASTNCEKRPRVADAMPSFSGAAAAPASCTREATAVLHDRERPPSAGVLAAPQLERVAWDPSRKAGSHEGTLHSSARHRARRLRRLGGAGCLGLRRGNVGRDVGIGRSVRRSRRAQRRERPGRRLHRPRRRGPGGRRPDRHADMRDFPPRRSLDRARRRRHRLARPFDRPGRDRPAPERRHHVLPDRGHLLDQRLD